MSVRPVDFSTIQRINEVSQIKHNEINKPIIDQSNIHNKIAKDISSKSEQINSKDNINHTEEKFDAKEKGSNEYYKNNSEKKNIEESELELEGRVFLKGQKGFDVKI